jgi:hypothetical protein
MYEKGITAIMVNRDEPTFESSLVSILEYVDKVVLVDSSEHAREKVREFAKGLDNVEYWFMYPNYGRQINYALSRVKTRWVIRWDSDFTTRPSYGELIALIKLHGGGKYFIEHGVKDTVTGEVHYEDYAFTNDPRLLKLHVRKIWRRLLRRKKSVRGYVPYPLGYRMIRLEEPYVLHHDTSKPKWRKVEGKYQRDWSLMSDRGRDKYPGGFREYVKRREYLEYLNSLRVFL